MKKYVGINDWIQIKISGPQTFEYLNGIITYDLENLEQNQTIRSAFLTPNSKIRSVYWVEKEGSEILIYCPAKMKENLVEDLLKYKLSMDVKLEDITEETANLYLVETDSKKIPGLSNDSISFDFSNFKKEPDGKKLSYSEFSDLLVINGIVPPEIMLDQNPFEVGIDDAIGLEKGCFLGQEPLSRMFHRGNLRQYLYLLKSENEFKSDLISHGENDVGEILVKVKKGQSVVGIGFIRRGVSSLSELDVGGEPIEVIEKIGNYPNISRN